MPGETAPLSPKSGDALRVIALGRISTIHQDVENIAASYRYIENHLGRLYQGPLDITFLGEQASGMRTDRATIRQAEDMIAEGRVDLVIAEDLSRIYRNPRHQYNFVQDAVDVGTRVILIGDNLDTADENWEVTMGAAALRHGLHIPDTRRRVRRTATHAFHQGGMVQKIRFGYRKLSREDAALGAFGPQGLRIAKVPDHTPTIRELARRVMAGESYVALADHLNDLGIAPGPYVTSGRWTSRILIELLSDPILAGMRTFRDTLCRPVFRTGRHRTERNPSPETVRYPELAHLSEAEFADLRSAMAARKRERRMPESGASRRCVARSRTLWPGQALRCAVCGGLFHLCGATMRCSRSTARSGRQCWNHVQLRTAMVRERLIEWLLTLIQRSAAHGALLRDRLVEFERLLTERADVAQTAAVRKLAALRRQAQALTDAVAEGGELTSLIQRLRDVESEIKSLQVVERSSQRPNAKSEPSSQLNLPELIGSLLARSYPFADWLRRSIPEFVVHPAQAWDTPQIRPIGILRVDVSRIEATSDNAANNSESLEEFEMPLFEEPRSIGLLIPCAAVRRQHPDWSLRRIADELGVNTMSVKRAFDYERLMAQAGTSKPYRILREAPVAASRWRGPSKKS